MIIFGHSLTINIIDLILQTKRNLNLSPALLDEIKANLNIIINSAASVDLNVRITDAVRINVAGPL